jgi:D-hexose-6-phosphate mutarotase
MTFNVGPDGSSVAEINNELATANVFLPSAQVTFFKPDGQEDILFLSGHSIFESGKAILGGIPISWPWFADHPTDKGKPAHGFARIKSTTLG